MFDTIVVQPIFNVLMAIYSIIPGGDFGIAIVIFTILVRFAMYPLIKKQLHQTKIMRKIQPELTRIKRQANGNRQLEGTMMLELYKKNDISPFRSIGILLIQMPIFIGLFSVIQIFTLHRDQLAKFTYDFLENIGPIQHLIANPSSLNEKFLGVFDLTHSAISASGIDVFLVILAVVSAYTQYIMTKQTMPAAPAKRKKFREIIQAAADGKEADTADMNAAMMANMTKFLPFMMLMIMLSVPGALALYYSVSNLVAVWQQSRLLGRDEEELEEMADAVSVQPKPKKSAREKSAKEAVVTRIVAKDTKKRR